MNGMTASELDLAIVYARVAARTTCSRLNAAGWGPSPSGRFLLVPPRDRRLNLPQGMASLSMIRTARCHREALAADGNEPRTTHPLRLPPLVPSHRVPKRLARYGAMPSVSRPLATRSRKAWGSGSAPVTCAIVASGIEPAHRGEASLRFLACDRERHRPGKGRGGPRRPRDARPAPAPWRGRCRHSGRHRNGRSRGRRRR